MFPLAFNASGQLEGGPALAGGLLQAVSHATAKAAMFLAVGSIYVGMGHDRVSGLRGVARALPLSVLTFAIGGLALMGVQPGGAALAKELLLQETARTAQWWWAIVLQAGGMFTAAYVVLVLANALAPSVQPLTPAGPPRRSRDLAALVLALLSLSLGLVPWQPYLPIPHDLESKLFGIDGFVKLLLPVLGGTALAILFSPSLHLPTSSAAWKTLTSPIGALRRICLEIGNLVERGDLVLRQWFAAGISLLLLALAFAALMFAAR